MSSILKNFQSMTVDRLISFPFFASNSIEVFPEHIKDIGYKIDQALKSLKRCVVVMTPTASVQYVNLPKVYFDDISILIRVFETPTLNEAGPGALDIAENVLIALHQWLPENVTEHVFPARPTIVLGNDPNRYTYDLRFTTKGGIELAIPQVAQPTIADNGSGQITLACATVGANIWYQTNGSTPAPRNGTLYTAPFTIPNGTKLRVRAWLAGYITSGEASYTRP